MKTIQNNEPEWGALRKSPEYYYTANVIYKIQGQQSYSSLQATSLSEFFRVPFDFNVQKSTERSATS